MKSLAHPDWVRRLNLFGDAIGDPRVIVSLDPDELLALARATTGLDDLGEADWPGWDETYGRLLASVDAESQLHLLGRVLTRAEVLRVLQTWLRLAGRVDDDARDRRRADRRARCSSSGRRAPARRSCSSCSRSTRSCARRSRGRRCTRSPRWAIGRPRRAELAESEQEFWADIDPEFMTMHELASDLPCECVHFLMYDFAGPYWSMLYDTPSFTGWQLEHLETLGRVYRLHRRMLQTFQHGDDPTPRRGC